MIKELDALAARLNNERAALMQTLSALTEEQAERIILSSGWSVKDTVAHLAGAERGMLRMMQRMASGENPRLSPEYNNDEYNRRQVAKRKEKSLEEIRSELHASRAELMMFMEGLAPEKLPLPGEHPLLGDTHVIDVLQVIGSHEAEQGKEISDRIREQKI